MPLMRNPFRKTPDDLLNSHGQPVTSPLTSPQRPTPLDIPPRPAEYKMSEISQNGVYLPPSPPAYDKPRFWTTRSTTSTSSSSHRSAMTEDDNPFTISRESFDSYRRSFDICARSPIADHEAVRTRQSTDIARLRFPPPRLHDGFVNPPATQPEERFEDVGLVDEAVRPKKQGILSRFTGHSTQDMSAAETSRPGSSHLGSQLFWRKRAQSGGPPPPAELSSMPQQVSRITESESS